MTELIRIEEVLVNNNLVKTVNARDLHFKLESKQEFSNWIKDRIEKYDFIEWTDFLINLSKTNWRPRKEFIFKIDIAKEIAMVENNVKGKEMRKYFIEIEKEYNKPLTEIEMAEKYLANLRRVEVLKLENKELEKTKAYISDKKTATAMNTASQKIKENKKLTDKVEELETLIDESNEYHTVRKMEKENKCKYNWRLLKSISSELWYEVQKIPDPLYWEVNTYNKNVWIKAYNIKFD